MPLPKPIGRQVEVLYLPAVGHTVVLGTAGSGKSTLAILRAIYLANRNLGHGGSTLLLTFNRSLVQYLLYLKKEAGDTMANVTVENYHKFARGYLHAKGLLNDGDICDEECRRTLLYQMLLQVRKELPLEQFLRRSIEFFEDEIAWLVGTGCHSYDQYAKALRAGRGSVRLTPDQRKLIFRIYERYLDARSKLGKLYDWDDLASTVLDTVMADNDVRRYRHIIIDEGQDFSVEMLRSLAAYLPLDGSLTFFGDLAQQIYGHGTSWRTAGLNISRVWYFEDNYRNSPEIAQLAMAISEMPYFVDTVDLVKPTPRAAEGPPIVLVSAMSLKEQMEVLIPRALEASRTRSVGMLVKNHAELRKLESFLLGQGKRLAPRMTWTASAGLYYGTIHSAKGLEFDMVILPFCGSGELPSLDLIQRYGDEVATARDGKTLYVGVTRARQELVISCTGAASPMLPSNAIKVRSVL